MGNCQAIDTATLVVQHPCGKSDKYYFPVSASEIMKMNPGHYVALLISTTLCNQQTDTTTTNNKNNVTTTSVRVTRIKLLRPTDTLLLGQVYRLITNQDVIKGLMAKKQAKNRTGATPTDSSNQSHRLVLEKPTRSHFDKDNNNQVMKKLERQRPSSRITTTTTTNSSSSSSSSSSSASSSSVSAMSKSRIWQPSLQSISEAQT